MLVSRIEKFGTPLFDAVDLQPQSAMESRRKQKRETLVFTAHSVCENRDCVNLEALRQGNARNNSRAGPGLTRLNRTNLFERSSVTFRACKSKFGMQAGWQSTSPPNEPPGFKA